MNGFEIESQSEVNKSIHQICLNCLQNTDDYTMQSSKQITLFFSDFKYFNKMTLGLRLNGKNCDLTALKLNQQCESKHNKISIHHF